MGFSSLLLCFAAAAGPEPEPERPNVVLILADDMGSECVGCYGGTSYATPHLDALAASGMRFTHAYSTPLCTPSRVKLMTGRSGIRNYAHFSILDREERTFAHALGAAGYRTAVVGKWQLLGAEHYGERAGTGTGPADAGFERWLLWQVDRLGSRYWDPLLERDGELLEGTEGRYGPDLFCEFALGYVDEHADEPFFLYYPMALPHSPFVPTPASADRTSGDRARNFADMVAYVDAVVGRVVGQLERLGLRERTLVLFTCDNGTSRSIVSVRDGREVTGGKRLTTDAGTRVPLIASWPGTVPAGSVCDDLVDFSDFLPTLVEFAGAEPEPGAVLDGRSFLPQLQGEPGTPREWLYCYYNPRPGKADWPEVRYVQDARFKLYGDGRLYDLVDDPLEERPLERDGLAVEAEAALRKLRGALDSMPREPAKLRP